MKRELAALLVLPFTTSSSAFGQSEMFHIEGFLTNPGKAVCPAGDVDGDGHGDFAIGYTGFSGS